ncbi:MAG: hypothetical protein H7831_07330 [Magnetococcus sp. WYHC-3]
MKVSYDIDLPPAVHGLVDELNRLIGPVYLVGGSLRRSLRGEPLSNDLDLLVDRPLAVCQQRLKAAGFEGTAAGARTPCLIVPIRGHQKPNNIMLCTFRHRPGQPATLEEELLHRDITQNAMAYEWPSGPLVDPFQGLQDMKAGRIRLVNGSAALAEDGLHALRFVRFLLQTGGTPAPDQLEACLRCTPTLVDPDRMRAEFDRLLALPLQEESQRELFLRLFEQPLVHALLPEVRELAHHPSPCDPQQSAWSHALKTLLALRAPPPDQEDISLLDLRWCALAAIMGRTGTSGIQTNAAPVTEPGNIGDLPPPPPSLLPAGEGNATCLRASPFLNRLNFTKRRQRRICAIIGQLPLKGFPGDRALKRMIRADMPIEGLFRLYLALQTSVSGITQEERDKWVQEFRKAMNRCLLFKRAVTRLDPRELALSGGEILDLVRLAPGPWLGRLQAELVDWVSQERSRNRRDLLEQRVREWVGREAVF